MKEYADWYQKGYIRKDILTADNVSQEIYEVRGGGNYLAGQGYYPTDSEIATSEAAGSTAYVKIPFDNSHYIPWHKTSACRCFTALNQGVKCILFHTISLMQLQLPTWLFPLIPRIRKEQCS